MNSNANASPEVVEFTAGEQHPDMPASLKQPEIRDSVTADDMADAENTLGKLHSSHKAERTLVYPNPDNPTDTLTFVYKRIDPGTSLLLNDVAIITAFLYNKTHEKLGDSMERADKEGRLEEYIQCRKNQFDYENKIISLGLVVPKMSVEQVGDMIRDTGLRSMLFNAITGGAVATDEDDPSDVDIFPETAEEQRSSEEASSGGSV